LYIFVAEVRIAIFTSSVAGQNLPEHPSKPIEEAKNSLQKTHSLISVDCSQEMNTSQKVISLLM